MHQDRRRLWLIAGTGEGPDLAQRLLACGWQLTVSVVTPAAAAAYPPQAGLELRIGALQGEVGVAAELGAADAAGRPYAVVVDASHPFAQQVSGQLARVCRARGQRLLRLQRSALAGSATLLADLDQLRQRPLRGTRLLLAIGGRQLARAVACSPGAEHHARVLPSAAALQLARAAGLADGRIACLRPGGGEHVERALVRRWAIGTVLARQSGGATEALWRGIAAREGVELLLLARPAEPAGSELLEWEPLLATLAAGPWPPP